MFAHDAAYSGSKDLTKRTVADGCKLCKLCNVLRDKVCNIAKDPKNDEYQRGLAAMVYTFFDKKSASLAYKSTEVSRVTAVTNKSVSQKQQLAKELHKPIIKKIKK